MAEKTTATLAISTGEGVTAPSSPVGVAEMIVDSAISGRLVHDPIIAQMTWAVALVALIISIGKPIRDYVRGEKRENNVDRVADAKTNAESVLYEHLSEQVSQYRIFADQASRERNTLIERVAALEGKAEELIESKQLVERLKERLDRKDDELVLLFQQSAEERKQFLEILQKKDNEISRRDERILVLENGLRELEARLSRRETIINTFSCPVRPQATPQPEHPADQSDTILPSTEEV